MKKVSLVLVVALVGCGLANSKPVAQNHAPTPKPSASASNVEDMFPVDPVTWRRKPSAHSAP